MANDDEVLKFNYSLFKAEGMKSPCWLGIEDMISKNLAKQTGWLDFKLWRSNTEEYA